MKQWYKVTVYRAHRGAGRDESVPAYFYADDIREVLGRYRGMPGVKRNPREGQFPSVRELSQEESLELEKRIAEEGRISLDEAKRTWYYSEFI